MAKAKAGARNIVVNDVKYRWRASGNDDYISLVVWPTDLPGPTLISRFDYGQIQVDMNDRSTRLIRQIVITNRIVRRVIEYATNDRGYDPRCKGPELELRDIEQAIDLSDVLRSG